MSSKARQQASGSATKQYSAAGAVPKGHAKAAERKRARHRSYYARQGLPWFKVGVGALAVLLVGLLLFNVFTTGYGTMTPQSTSYEFGNVPFKGGLIYTKFPITVDGDVTVNDIVST